MPPKKKENKNTKVVQKKKAKDLEDKTFGLKNKNKSKKVQKQIEQIQKQADGGRRAEELAKKKAAEKAAAEKAKKEALLLNAPVFQQKVPFGVDPKSVLCILFKDGKCTKGAKCKFSHDLTIGRKSAKKDLYTDDRKEKKETETSDDWDEDTLRKVVKSKQGNSKTTTDKICHHFLEAVENGKYGWFWVCPNGGNDCKYKHSLPEGFVLKTKEQRRLEQLAADSAPKLSLEEFIDLEKDKLGKNLTPITEESFAKWKKTHQFKKSNKNSVGKNGKRLLTGKEVIEQRFKDKLFVDGDNTNADNDGDDNGTVWDLSEFQKSLREAEQNETYKDYGDGTKYTFEEEKNAEKNTETNGEETAEKTESKQSETAETVTATSIAETATKEAEKTKASIEN